MRCVVAVFVAPCFTPTPLPQLSVRSLFIRGGVVRYVHLPADAIDTELLQDAARKEAMLDNSKKA